MKRRALLLTMCTTACATVPQAGVDAALQHYADALRRQDASAVADCFLPDGTMAHEGQDAVAGPAAIRAFLAGFSAYRVLAYRIEPDSTHVSGEAASQSGRWAQTVRTPEGQVVQVQGRFTIDWRRDAGGRWRIARLHTQPASKIGELLPHRWTSEAT